MYRLLILFSLLGLAGVGVVNAATNESKPSAAEYRLYSRDLIRLTVRNEPDVSVDQRIDEAGEIKVPLIGQLKVSRLTLGEAQSLVAAKFREGEIFVHPEVFISVLEYAPKEVMVLGQVGKQGKQTFPPEADSMSIVEAITAAGGLTRISKGDGVRVTRKDEQGVEHSFTVDVQKLIEGRGSREDAFQLQPGDVVFVPERVF